MKKVILLFVIVKILNVLAIILLILLNDFSKKNDIENSNSKNSKFCIGITNKADFDKVMDENPCKIH